MAQWFSILLADVTVQQIIKPQICFVIRGIAGGEVFPKIPQFDGNNTGKCRQFISK